MRWFGYHPTQYFLKLQFGSRAQTSQTWLRLLPAQHANKRYLSHSVELKFNLDQYVHKRYPGLVKVVRNSRREGLIRARLQGWKVATAPIVGFFDAHVEFNTGW